MNYQSIVALLKNALVLGMLFTSTALFADGTAGFKLQLGDGPYASIDSVINTEGFPEIIIDKGAAKVRHAINEEHNYIVTIKQYFTLDAQKPIQANLINYYRNNQTGELHIVNEVIFITDYTEMFCGNHKYGIELDYWYSTVGSDGLFHPVTMYGALGSVSFIDTDNDGKYDLMTRESKYGNYVNNLPDIYFTNKMCVAR